MIATTLRGGLGNQMFIYAAARAMALRNGTDMTFNLHYGFDIDYQFHRKLELSNLNVDFGKNNKIATFDYKQPRSIRYISRKLGRNVLAPQYKFIIEKEPPFFQKEIFHLQSKNVYLEGYWQSEKYFADFKEQIRKDFTIITEMPDAIEDELSLMWQGTENLVFIGIRRYQDCATTTPGMVLEEEYYNKAIQLMESKLTNPKFVVFTQQPEWAKTHIVAHSPIMYATPKESELSTIEDMYLMRHCRHAIISNSSFYWWGAWLSEYNDGVVVCPTNFNNRDMALDSWIKFDNTIR